MTVPAQPVLLQYQCYVSQTIEKLFFKMAYGGHFGFLPTTTYAHTFESDTPSSFIR